MTDKQKSRTKNGNSTSHSSTTPRRGEQAKKGLSVVGKAEAPTIDNVERPSFAVYRGPTKVEGKLLQAGTWYHGIKQAGPGDEGVPVDRRLCGPLFVDAETIDSEDGAHGRLLRFKCKNVSIEWVMPMEMLMGDEPLRALFRMGLQIEYRWRKLILEYIASFHYMSRSIATTKRVGWHKSGAFVLPAQVIGSGDVRYQETGRAAEIFSMRGDLESWKKEIAGPCAGNPVLILSVCCAFAGPLLEKVGVGGGGVHLVGDSSSGKSLAQLVAATVFGDPERFAASWDATKGGIEIEAASRNNTILILDEIKRANPKWVQEIAYAIANGVGKGTMTKDREARAKLTWRLLFLSSGERSLAEHAALSGNPSHAGAELRIVDINAGTRKFRAFDNVHGKTGEQFHRELSVAVTHNYGHAGPALVKAIIDGEGKDDLGGLYNKVREHFEAESAQAGRVADRFAIMAMAGEYAISKRILPWRKGSALSACKQLFCEWLETVGDGNAEDRQILQAIADFIDMNADGRFSPREEGPSYGGQPAAPIVRDRAGYIDQPGAEESRRFLFFRKPLVEAADGFGLSRVLTALETAGAIEVTEENGRKRHQKKFRLPGGGSGRFYVIDPEKLHLTR
jgi:putative DNA primase/helicase